MLDIEITGIDDAINSVNRLVEKLEQRINTILERLMKEGYDIADAGFREGEAKVAGKNGVIVKEPYWDGDTLYLTAEGDYVAFIEFGTGTVFEDYPIKVEGVLAHGEYGKKKGANPPWTYVGEPGNMGIVKAKKKDGSLVVETVGNPPNRAMYNASKVFTKANVERIAKEIFND